jgi:uncharacterized membrane protein
MAASKFSEEEKQRITGAIAEAEKRTSGEIRVHIESRCKEQNILDRAAHMFAKLDMHKTDLRNGVLIYIALEDHRFAVIGDKGIHARVPDSFWDNVAEIMSANFREGRIIDGIIAGVETCGKELAADFPLAEDDIDELPNEISFGE